jgi:CRISP-associated protein Cas1
MQKQEIIIKSSDAYLSYKNPYLLCTVGDEKKKVNGGAISSILVMEPCVLDSSIFEMIHRYGITILFNNGTANAKCKCVPIHQKLHKDAYKNQLQQSFDENKDLRSISIQWLHAKFEKRKDLLEKYLSDRNKDNIAKYNTLWYEDVQQAQLETDPSIMIREAHSSKLYWNLFNKCLPHELRFTKRSKHPGEDLTNVLLNYGYGILYSVIEKTIISQGLDPTCGIFHADGPSRKSLVYDMIEAHRHEVEHLVIQFANEHVVTIAAETFKSSTLPVSIKSIFMEKWRSYNQECKVTKNIVAQVADFKNELLNLKTEEE